MDDRMTTDDLKKILIVDDHPENLQTIIEIFSKEEPAYSILKAPNGKIALEITEKFLPDLIITDWEMPEMDGIELIQNLKKNETTADIPIIMYTGVMTTSGNLNTALDAGAIDYIRKPVDKIELIARTRATLHLSEKYKEIKNLNHTKDKFFSIIAHDLRAPFNAIIGLADMMKDRCSGCAHNDTNDFVTHIGDSARSTFELLENLLEWAKSQRGDIPFQLEKYSLTKIIEKSLRFSEHLALNKNIKIQLHPCEDDEVVVSLDKNMINTVMNNLVSNAIKFTHKGGNVDIQISNKGEVAQVDVIDHGIGVREQDIKDIFRIDKNISHKGTEDEKGTGLGLILCKEFIDKHGGEIWAESEEGKGSKFSFTIPMVN